MLILFTDLDGSLLDPFSYSFEEVLDILERIKKRKIPLIFCSSKTRAEQEFYRKALGINDPFIVENGGAILIPEDYFPFSFSFQKAYSNYLIIEFGISYFEVRRILEEIKKKTKLKVKGFGDMSPEEIAKETGLSIEMAALAKQREYEETLKIEGDEGELKIFLQEIKSRGLNWHHGGRFYSIGKGNDKGKAVRALADLFKRKFKKILTVGIGDSQNDFSMLAAVDIPILVQKPGGWWEDIEIRGIRKVEGVGPEGWKKGIGELLRGGENNLQIPLL